MELLRVERAACTDGPHGRIVATFCTRKAPGFKKDVLMTISNCDPRRLVVCGRIVTRDSINVAEWHTDDENRPDLALHAEIEEPDFTAIWIHSPPHPTARKADRRRERFHYRPVDLNRKEMPGGNSAMKIRFSCSGSASNASKSSTVCLLITQATLASVCCTSRASCMPDAGMLNELGRPSTEGNLSGAGQQSL